MGEFVPVSLTPSYLWSNPSICLDITAILNPNLLITPFLVAFFMAFCHLSVFLCCTVGKKFIGFRYVYAYLIVLSPVYNGYTTSRQQANDIILRLAGLLQSPNVNLACINKKPYVMKECIADNDWW